MITENKDWNPRIKRITDRYKQVFNGIGKIRDIKNDKNLYTKFTMKPEAVSVAQKPQPIAYYLQKPLTKWLEQCIDEDIFEEVLEGEPVTWCFTLVVQPKPIFSSNDKDQLERRMIRASIDLRVPNQYMERHRITQELTVEDYIYKLHDSTMSSKLDTKQGYHQLLFDPESQEWLQLSVPHGETCERRD